MASKVGKLIKEARTGADLTQEKLAKKVGGGLTANDISLAERGEKDLTQAQLKKIATITGVTQASLINAAKGTSSKKTTTAKKTEKKTEKKKPAPKKEPPKEQPTEDTTNQLTLFEVSA